MLVCECVSDCFDRALVFSRDDSSWSLSATLVPHELVPQNRAISGIALHQDLAVVMASSWRGSSDYSLLTYKRSSDTNTNIWSSQAVIRLPDDVHSCADKGCLSVYEDTIAVSIWVINSFSATDRMVSVYQWSQNASDVGDWDWVLLAHLAPKDQQYPAVTAVSTFYQVSNRIEFVIIIRNKILIICCMNNKTFRTILLYILHCVTYIYLFIYLFVVMTV